MKFRILLISALMCFLGFSSSLYAQGNYHHHRQQIHNKPYYAHGRVHRVRPPIPRAQVHVHRHHGVSRYSRTHCHDTIC